MNRMGLYDCNEIEISLLNIDLMTVNKEMKNSDVGVFLRGNRVKALAWGTTDPKKRNFPP